MILPNIKRMILKAFIQMMMTRVNQNLQKIKKIKKLNKMKQRKKLLKMKLTIH